MREKAVQLMMKRFHCSQAVLAVGQEKLGRKDDEVVKAMGAFGGGLGGNGEVCGAAVGAIAVMGLRFSRSREEEKEDPIGLPRRSEGTERLCPTRGRGPRPIFGEGPAARERPTSRRPEKP